jgi:hypothetical protein
MKSYRQNILQKLDDNYGKILITLWLLKIAILQEYVNCRSPVDGLLHLVSYFWNFLFSIPYRTQDFLIGCVSISAELYMVSA